MSRLSWSDLESLFHDAVAREPAARAAFLAERCSGRPDIQAEIESLVLAHEQTRSEPGVAAGLRARLDVGAQVGPYQILSLLGAGGMGEVYCAKDSRLKRTVALKFLPPEMTRDEDARQRFILEAQAASALDHPNICTIYDIDTAPDGQIFLAMAYYDGETLKRRIERGPLSPVEALDVAMQVSQGLTKAHEAGIVHRDIKPANLMVTKDGAIKILDFGIAKLTGETGLTRTGMTPGTISYMAPEQLRGSAVDQRADLWSLGVVLYEMVTGELPFRGAAVSHAILSDRLPNAAEVRPETPNELQQIIVRALEKRADARYATAADLLKDLAECRSVLTAPRPVFGIAGVWRMFRRRRVAIPAFLVLLSVGALAALALSRGAEARWAREQAIPQIERHADAGNWEAAFALAKRVEAVGPQEPALAELWPRFSWITTIPSDPPGAKVFRRPYSATTDTWEELGTTPLEGIHFPFGLSTLRFELDGYRPLLRTLGTGILVGTRLQVASPFKLDTDRTLPHDKVRVAGWNEVVSGESVQFRDFFLSRYEVTNREYKKFVDAGGYKRKDLWEHPFVQGGRTIPWDEAMALLRDKTGRPGPSTWQAGDYPEGQDDHPVGGVSWYEAAAFARFVGEELPTVHHWRRAFAPEASAWLLPASNLEGDGPARVGHFRGISWPGTYDMSGNVREWCFNANGDQRFILGGGWNDPYHLGLNMNYAQPPLDRSFTNGFRLAITHDDERARARARASSAPAASVPAWLRVSEPATRSIAAEKAVSNEVFEAYRRIYAYDPVPLNATIEATESTRHWTREHISFQASYGAERMVLYLFLPRTGSPPYQTVLHWPGSAALNLDSIDKYQVHLDFVLKNGRAVAFPVYKRTFERGDRQPLPSASTAAFRDLVVQQVNDLRRSIDYLETRPDIDSRKLGYYGHSWGGANGPIVLATESRLRAAVLYVAGIYGARFLPEIDPVAFMPRVKVPVLMLNGELDSVFPAETNAKPFFELLGTRRVDKKLVIAPGGHFVPSPVLIRETLDWLDKYLGAT